MDRTQSDGLGGSSSPCLGTGSSPPCSGTLSQRLLSPVFGTSPLPTLLPPGEQVGGSAPQPPPRCLIFLSLFLMARGTPRCQDQKLQPAFFCSSHASEAGTSAEPGLPHSGTHRVLRTRPATAPMVPRAQSMRGSPARANLPQRGGAFPGGPRRFPSWYWPGKPSARF